MTGEGASPRSVLRRLRVRQELHLAAALSRADRPMATGWWSLLALRGLLPAGFSIATGVLVGAIQHRASLAVPLTVVGVLFVLLQVLGPLHTALSANLGDRTAAWLYDELTGACVAVPGIGHLEDPELAADLQVARDFDRGMTGPPLSMSMDFIAAGLVDMVAGLAQAFVLFGFAWWAPPVLAGAWLSTHWLLRESGVWKDRNTDEVRHAQRDADYAYRLAVDPPAAKELRIFGLPEWVLDWFVARRRRLHQLQYEATRMRERSVLVSLALVAGRERLVLWLLASAALDHRLDLGGAGRVRVGGGRHVHDRVRRAQLGTRQRGRAGRGRRQAQGGDGPRGHDRAGSTGRPTACPRTRSGSATSRSPTRPRRTGRCSPARPGDPGGEFAGDRRPERCRQDDPGQAAVPPVRPAVRGHRGRRRRPEGPRPGVLAAPGHRRVPGLRPVRADAAGERGPAGDRGASR